MLELLIHELILDKVQSDFVVRTALVNMYGKWGSLADAQKVFGKAVKRNIVSWTAIIAAYIEHGHENKALALFQ